MASTAAQMPVLIRKEFKTRCFAGYRPLQSLLLSI
jgi:hypothetical protein